ncbi:MAG: TrmJ/YjtD family RNA methyltransferase [Acidobacteriota bacterium]
MSNILKDNIHFVFVRTQFASNLGSSVRIMKNMGFRKLILVQPECEVGMEARSYAMKGADILESAEFLPSLEKAAEKLGVLIGTTARYRGRKRSLIDCRSLSEDLIPKIRNSPLGIVFGSENNGLKKEELPFCQWLVEIPTDSEYTVLNLAQAAAIVSYELNMAFRGTTGEVPERLAPPEQVDILLKKAELTLAGIKTSNRLSVEKVVNRLGKIARRAQLEKDDIKMLHGLLRELHGGREEV